MQSANGKYAGPRGESYTKYGEKTSEHGHWEVGDSYAGTNTDGERWRNQTMEWVEDNRKFEAPAEAEPEAAPEPEAEAPPKPVEYSPKMQEAKERVNAYKDGITSTDTTEAIFKTDTPTQLTSNFLNKDEFQFKKAQI